MVSRFARFSTRLAATDPTPAIAKTPSAQRSYVSRWVRYAAGRDPNSNDTCIVDQIAGNLSSGTYPIANMMADYTQADSFRLRTLGN